MNKLCFLLFIIRFSSSFGPNDVKLSMKQKLPNLDNSNAREKSSTNSFLLQPFDFFIALCS